MNPDFRRSARALLVALALLAAPCAALAGADPSALAAARAAANAGDTTRTIDLYDQLLAASPDDLTLLEESAQQLSWAGRYDEALRRYARVLAIDPNRRFALLEQAKVLGWAGRYAESAAAFRAMLGRDPADVDARLGLARALSLEGQQAAARDQYRQVLAAHPGNGEATLGIAQTYAWSGDLARARDYYRHAEAQLPDPLRAQIGLAYLDLWEGDLGSARSATAALAARHPKDKDVLELQRAVRRATQPRLSADWSQLHDTDHNLMTVSSIEAAGILDDGLGLGLLYARYDIHTAGTQGSIDSFQARADWSPRSGHHLEAMLGADRLDGTLGPSRVVTDWGLAYRMTLGNTWQGWLAARREPYRYSVPLIDNRIVVDSLAAGASGPLGAGWRLWTEVNGWDLSDGNRRLAADLSARYAMRLGSQQFEAGPVVHWLDWRQDVDHGYFDPNNFIAAGLALHASGPLGPAAQLGYDLSAEGGLQSFDFRGQRTSADPYYVAAARLAWQVSAAVRLEAYAEAGTYASQGSQNWRYSRVGARFVCQLGAAP